MNNHGKIAFSSALSFSIIYSVLTLLHVIWPHHVLKLLATAHHLKSFEPLQSEVTINNYIVGLIFNFVLVYILVWLAGIIYDAISKNRGY